MSAFERAPFIVVWETTRACALACVHCRAEAMPRRHLARLAVSLDGATAGVHDAFRGVSGSHRHTIRIIERARRLGLPLQINTTVCRQTVADLPGLGAQVEVFGAVLWALFFLIPIGRAHADVSRALRRLTRPRLDGDGGSSG